jgi:hypothetical protein
VVTCKATQHHNEGDYVQYLNCCENLHSQILKICPILLLSKQIPNGFPGCKFCNKRYVLKCFYYESEATDNEELEMDTSEASVEVSKTAATPRSCNSQRLLINHAQLQEIDEIALIKAVLEKMGHEVRLSEQAVLHIQVFSLCFLI